MTWIAQQQQIYCICNPPTAGKFRVYICCTTFKIFGFLQISKLLAILGKMLIIFLFYMHYCVLSASAYNFLQAFRRLYSAKLIWLG